MKEQEAFFLLFFTKAFFKNGFLVILANSGLWLVYFYEYSSTSFHHISISNPDSFTAPTQYPQNFKGFNTSSYSIRVQWERVSEQYRHGVILGYKLQYKSQSDTTWTVVSLSGTSNKSLAINGLNNYTLYDLKVSAYNSKGTGVESNIQVRTDDASKFPGTLSLKILLSDQSTIPRAFHLSLSSM